MDNCIFCKIVKKEIPAHILFENEKFMAFLDIRPLSPGHALIIPKEHHRWVWDVPELHEYFDIAKKIVDAERKAFKTESIWSKVVGEEVPHAHLWVYPNPHEAEGDKEDFENNAKKVIENLSA